MLTIVASPKVKMINVRLTPYVHDQFKIACELKGGSMSSILHQFIVRTIREEMQLEPQAFKKLEETIPVAVTDDPDLELTEPKKKRKGGRG